MVILVRAVDNACNLINNGAGITAQMVNGITASRLVVRLNLPAIVRKLLDGVPSMLKGKERRRTEG